MNGWQHKKILCLCKHWRESNQWGEKKVAVELTFMKRLPATHLKALCKGRKPPYFSQGKGRTERKKQKSGPQLQSHISSARVQMNQRSNESVTEEAC